MNSVNKLVWLVNKLMERKALTFDEISWLWMHEGTLNNGSRLSRRTFHQWVRNVEEMFGLRIVCDKRASHNYSIANPEIMDDGSFVMWFLNTLSLGYSMERYRDLWDRIVFEDVPSAQNHLMEILESMRRGCAIEFMYHNYERDDYRLHTLYPYFVKLSERRWYVLGFSEENKMPRTYSLDRFESFNMLKEKRFRYDPEKNCHDESYGNSVGIFHGGEPEVITFRASGIWVWYLRSLKVHKSQVEKEMRKRYSVFEICASVTPDLDRKFLAYGPNVEVLGPSSYRERFTKIVDAMYKIYHKGE